MYISVKEGQLYLVEKWSNNMTHTSYEEIVHHAVMVGHGE